MTAQTSFSFTQGSLAIAVSSTDGPVLDAFFAGYNRCFVLPSEREELPGFRACLALNAGEADARLERTFGPHSEVVLVARAGGDDGPVIGGANFIAFPIAPDQAHGHAATISLNLNYAYVLPEYRGRNYLRTLIDAIGEIVRHSFAGPAGDAAPSSLVFFEINDPLRLDPEASARDTDHSGLDQMHRVAIWGRLGARIVDFPYVQPALSADHEANDTLLYAVIGADAAALSACLLQRHLSAFFGISVLKGADPERDPAAGPQLRRLATDCDAGRPVALLDIDPAALDEIAACKDRRPGESLRDALRARLRRG